jgi:hypothetical protein
MKHNNNAQAGSHRRSMVDGSLGGRLVDQGEIVVGNVAPLIVKSSD